MSGESSSLAVYSEYHGDTIDITLQAFTMASFEAERRTEKFDRDIPSMSIPHGNRSLNISLPSEDDLDPHEPILTMSFGEWLNPANWENTEEYRQFFDNCIELICRLATGFDAEYVPVFDFVHRAEVLPLESPLADHIDQTPQIGVYSQSLLDEFGGFANLFTEPRWEYSQPPWRVGELDNGSLLVITHPRPWTDGGWTESSYVDLHPGEDYI